MSDGTVARRPSGWHLAQTVAPFAFTVAPSVAGDAMRAIYNRIDWSNSRLNAAMADQQAADRAASFSQPPRTRRRLGTVASASSTRAGYRYLSYPRRRIVRRRRTAYRRYRRYRY